MSNQEKAELNVCDALDASDATMGLALELVELVDKGVVAPNQLYAMREAFDSIVNLKLLMEAGQDEEDTGEKMSGNADDLDCGNMHVISAGSFEEALEKLKAFATDKDKKNVN